MKLYSDDFGYNPRADKEILKLVRRDRLFGLSVIATMVSQDRLRQLVSTLVKKKEVKIGLHINLIEGKPSSHFLNIKSLVDREGKFFPLPVFLVKLFLGKVDRLDIKSEIQSQLNLLKKRNLQVDMLDSHQHTHAFSPIAEIVEEIADEESVAQIRNFNSIKIHSLRGRLTLMLVKFIAFLSYLVAYKKIGFPVSWRSAQKLDWTVMSRESDSFAVEEVVRRGLAFIIHPFLPFDKNKSYQKYI